MGKYPKAYIPSFPSFDTDGHYGDTNISEFDSCVPIYGDDYPVSITTGEDDLSHFIKCPYCGVDNEDSGDIYCVGCGAPIDHFRKEW
jgi:hypothetical protein